MKTPTKAEPASTAKATDTLIAVAEAVLAYCNDKRVTLVLLSRIMNRASGLLRINDIDERMELPPKPRPKPPPPRPPRPPAPPPGP
jgi:hypothetical protein